MKANPIPNNQTTQTANEDLLKEDIFLQNMPSDFAGVLKIQKEWEGLTHICEHSNIICNLEFGRDMFIPCLPP